MAMGLPKVFITFRNIAEMVTKQKSYGKLALILSDSSVTELTALDFYPYSEMSETLSAENQDYIKMALKGFPDEVKVIVLPAPIEPEVLDIAPALNFLEMTKTNIIAAPGQGATIQEAVSTWVKNIRTTKGNKVAGVVANVVSDHEGVFNFTTSEIVTSQKTYTAEEFIARIAGLIAGLPLDIAPTYSVLEEVRAIPIESKATIDGKIDAGEIVLIHDGEKVKIGRGVTSLTLLREETSEDWKKIKLTRIYDKIYTDIFSTIEDNYIGKVGNSYQNKINLVSAISGYLKRLEEEGILQPGTSVCEISVEAQRTYLMQSGYVTKDGRTAVNMTDQEIKEADTKDNVFLRLVVKGQDAMENAYINVFV